jgi:hypothetical protein
MLQVYFEYKTVRPFTEVFEGKPYQLDTLVFRATSTLGASWARLEIPISTLPGDKEVLYKAVKTDGGWMAQLLWRRTALQEAIAEYFGADEDEFDKFLLLVSEQLTKNDRVIYSR